MLTLDRSRSPTRISFEAGFNAAVAFIDRHLAEGRGAKVAIRTATGDVSYAELFENVNRSGNALVALGLEPGQRLLMIVRDCPEFFYLFWGAIKAGIVPVPVNTLLRREDYQHMIDDSACAAVTWSTELGVEVEPALGGASNAPRLALALDALRTEMDRGGADLHAVPADATAPCFWLYSSGSTGRPNAAVHCHRDMVVTSQLYGADTLGAREDDVFFSAAKLFFAYGLGNAMTFPLWAGATSVLLESRPTPESTFEVIERFRPTLYFGVPTLYAAQLQALERHEPDLTSIRWCVSAGEALPADIFRRWKERTGRVILDGIGSTELLHIFISNRPDELRPGTSGRIVAGYEARIVSDSGEELGANEQGRLHVRGESAAVCYWNNAAKTARTMLGEGWLDTGDTYVRDDDGYYQYCGRSDDMVKVGGIWCSPIEIEAELIAHPAVLEVAIVGAHDENGLMKPVAFIVLREGTAKSDGLEAELIQLCKARLPPYKFPRRFCFVSELPKTATGKVQRFRLRRMAEEQR